MNKKIEKRLDELLKVKAEEHLKNNLEYASFLCDENGMIQVSDIIEKVEPWANIDKWLNFMETSLQVAYEESNNQKQIAENIRIVLSTMIEKMKPDLFNPALEKDRDIIKYKIERLTSLHNQYEIYSQLPDQINIKNKEAKKTLPAKYFALYHWILIKLGKEQGFEKNENDQWPKERIKNFAKKKYGPGKDRGVTLVSEERFYQEFKGLDITNKVAIARSFGPGYKEKLIEISGNDADVIHYLKDWPS